MFFAFFLFSLSFLSPFLFPSFFSCSFQLGIVLRSPRSPLILSCLPSASLSGVPSPISLPPLWLISRGSSISRIIWRAHELSPSGLCSQVLLGVEGGRRPQADKMIPVASGGRTWSLSCTGCESIPGARDAWQPAPGSCLVIALPRKLSFSKYALSQFKSTSRNLWDSRFYRGSWFLLGEYLTKGMFHYWGC